MANFSPPATAAAASSSGIARAAATPERLAEHKDSITSLSWRGDSKLLASGSEDGQIIVWNVADGFPLSTISKAHTPKAAPNTYGVIPGGVLGVQFTSDGRIVSVGRDSTIRIWSADWQSRRRQPQMRRAAHQSGRLLRWQTRHRRRFPRAVRALGRQATFASARASW